LNRKISRKKPDIVNHLFRYDLTDLNLPVIATKKCQFDVTVAKDQRKKYLRNRKRQIKAEEKEQAPIQSQSKKGMKDGLFKAVTDLISNFN